VLFAGASGAGKTTHGPAGAGPRATLLTDEVSYVRKLPEGYFCVRNPLCGELKCAGGKRGGTVGVLYLLKHGPVNHIEAVGESVCYRALLESILFFARDPELVKLVFETAADFVRGGAGATAHVSAGWHGYGNWCCRIVRASMSILIRSAK